MAVARLSHPRDEHSLVERILQIVHIVMIVVHILAVCNLIVILVNLLETVIERLLRIVLVRVYDQAV